MSATNSPSAISSSNSFTTDTGPLGPRKVLVRLVHLKCFFISILDRGGQGTTRKQRHSPERAALRQIQRLDVGEHRQRRCLGCRFRDALAWAGEPAEDL